MNHIKEWIRNMNNVLDNIIFKLMYEIQILNVVWTYLKMLRKEVGKFFLFPFKNSPDIGHCAAVSDFAQKPDVVFEK